MTESKVQHSSQARVVHILLLTQILWFGPVPKAVLHQPLGPPIRYKGCRNSEDTQSSKLRYINCLPQHHDSSSCTINECIHLGDSYHYLSPQFYALLWIQDARSQNLWLNWPCPRLLLTDRTPPRGKAATPSLANALRMIWSADINLPCKLKVVLTSRIRLKDTRLFLCLGLLYLYTNNPIQGNKVTTRWVVLSPPAQRPSDRAGLGEIRLYPQVPSAGFEPRTSTSRVGRSTDWATWRLDVRTDLGINGRHLS